MARPAATYDGPSSSPPADRLSAGLVVGVLAGLAAAWIAAGDAGLLHHALRHALTWVAMLAAVVACWPERRGLWGLLWIAAAAVAAVAMTASSLAPVNVLAVPVLLAGLAWGRAAPGGRVLGLAAQATAIFGIYRMAVTAIPGLWMRMDGLGAWLGHLGGGLVGRPLEVGAAFAGVDVLVLAAAFYGLWLAATPGPRLRRGLVAAAAIAAGHLVYLVVLSYGPDLAAAIPVPPPEPAKAYVMPSDIPPWSFWTAVATLLPWNLVAVAGIIQLIILGAMLRWSEPIADCGSRIADRDTQSQDGQPSPSAGSFGFSFRILLLVAVVILPMAAWRYSQPASLAGKKILVNKEGFINWLRPKHGDYGRLAIGMYGMLPDLVASYGGTLEQTTEFSDEELAKADAVLLIFPNKPWKHGQLERIWKYVDGGGSLLLVADHTQREPVPDLDSTPGQPLPPGFTVARTADLAKAAPEIGQAVGLDKYVVLSPEGEVYAHSVGASPEEAVRNVRLRHGSRFNDVLFPTAIRVNFDCAEWGIGGWLDCYEAMAHPTTAWSRGDRNDFGVVIGASLDIRAPARPLILGKWGWSDWGDPGSPRALIGNGKYDAGERLGDVCLVAEQTMGRGKVVVFGDTSTITNGIDIGSYGYTGGLLSYVTGREAAPSPLWQLAALLAALMAAAALAMRPPLYAVGGAAVAAALVLGLCFGVTHEANTPVLGRDPRQLPPYSGPGPAAGTPIAYIDMSHLEAFSQEGLRDDGMMGLELTLMRNGYQAFTMSDFSAPALERASVFISVAPAREFTAAEREAVRKFVENGGIFIATVGWDERLGSERLLSEFGLRVGRPGEPGVEPSPFGHFKAPFIQVAGEMHFVRFHAAWPVAASDDVRDSPANPVAKSIVLAYGPGDVPVIVMRPVGKNGGKVILIGDTCFAMNKNLEHMDGSPFEGMRENADFWRWLVSFATGAPEWLPPPSAPPPPAPAPPLAPRAISEFLPIWTTPMPPFQAPLPASLQNIFASPATTSTGGPAASGTPATPTSGPAAGGTAGSEVSP